MDARAWAIANEDQVMICSFSKDPTLLEKLMSANQAKDSKIYTRNPISLIKQKSWTKYFEDVVSTTTLSILTAKNQLKKTVEDQTQARLTLKLLNFHLSHPPPL
jgi:hypothetical protein